MLSKVISVFFIFTLSLIHSRGKVCFKKSNHCIMLYDSSSTLIKSGHIHILSNDLIVNDILFSEWDNQEKRGKNKIPNNGIFKINYSVIKMNNRVNADSISIIYRCDKGLGTEYRIPLKVDTVRINNVKRCMTN